MTAVNGILDDLLQQAGTDPADGAVRFEGSDPILPTRFHLADFGAAAIAAAALQASRLLETRGGSPQTVDVAVDAAAAGMRNWRYLHEVPSPPGASAFVATSFYPSADDRWVYFQEGLPHHSHRQRALLGLPDDAPWDDIAARTRTWQAVDLEQAVFDAGATASVVRTRDEWAQHPQSVAIASLPLFRLTRIGDADPRPAGSGDRPLGGTRVLDVTRVLAGPTAARTLAEQGADVLRIASPVYPERGMIRDTGHGKRSTMIDLRDADGRAALERLVRDADVFSQGYRPGGMAEFGFAPERLAELRPGIVAVSISAWGTEGPWRGYRGFDSVVQAASGSSWDERDEDGRPHAIPGNPLDYTTGYLAAFLVEVALARRAVEGGSWLAELSLGQTGRYLDDLGLFEQDAVRDLAPDLPPERLAELSIEGETGFGRLSYLGPIARLSRTPGHWDRPSVPLDNDPPEW